MFLIKNDFFYIVVSFEWNYKIEFQENEENVDKKSTRK